MGMFDTLHAPCPDCGGVNETQTKGGECILRDIHSDTAKFSEMGLFSDEVFYCEDCRISYEVVPVNTPKLKSIRRE
jgi:hypothetical protein